MAIYDVNGNLISSNGADSSGLFDIDPIIIPKNTNVPFMGDGLYAINPWSNFGSVVDNNRIFFTFKLKDENGDDLFSATQTQGYVFRINGLEVFNDLLKNFDLFTEGIFTPNTKVGTLTKKPSFIYYSVSGDPNAEYLDKRLSYWYVSQEVIDQNLSRVAYDTYNRVGFLEQINNSVERNEIDILSTRAEFARRCRTEIIRELNKMRHAIRIATFNIARNGQAHWYKIKECLQNYGIDIVGLQEVQYPNGGGTGMNKTLATYFNSWQFDSFSTNGSVGEFPNNGTYPNNVRSLMSGNGYKIDSTVETYLATQSGSGDHRYVAKSIVSLPRYKDKRGSENLKLSIYNTQLEVINANTAQAQAREILSMAQADENPFVIIMGDTNDFSLTKEVWKIFEDGGFTPVVGTNTSTVSGTQDFNCIDNFFLSSRISSLDWDVIWAQEYPWVNVTGTKSSALSDHDLVFADIKLDYSDIRCVNMFLDHCTSDWSKGWLTDNETVVINITADDGYTLPQTPNKLLDCMMTNAEALSYSSGTITIDGSKLVGDVYIKITAT